MKNDVTEFHADRQPRDNSWVYTASALGLAVNMQKITDDDFFSWFSVFAPIFCTDRDYDLQVHKESQLIKETVVSKYK